MEKYRIVKRYYRKNANAKIHHYYRIEKYVMFKSYFRKRYVWELYSESYYTDLNTLKQAKVYLKNLKIPIPQDEIIN